MVLLSMGASIGAKPIGGGFEPHSQARLLNLRSLLFLHALDIQAQGA